MQVRESAIDVPDNRNVQRFFQQNHFDTRGIKSDFIG